MAEAKRVTLTQIGSVKPKEKKEKPRLCHRFVLTLVDSTKKTCPEFSFNDLLKNATGGKEDFSEDENDPFSGQDRAEHEKMVALAKSFEEKYARPVSSKKPKKHKRVHEYVDLGDGYDETDPFIDNAEAYDELVPSCLTTQHGGFYINSGKLDFRAVSDDDDVFQTNVKKKRKKNQIVSDPESSDETAVKRGPKKKFKDGDDFRKKRRKKLSSSDLSDKVFAKRKKLDKEKLKSFKMKKKQNHNSSNDLLMDNSAPASNGLSEHHIVSQKDPEDKKQTTALANMESAIDSVISKAISGGADTSDSDSSMSPTPSGPPLSSELVPRLPDNLPDDIIEVVNKLKQAAKESEAGKCKFFSTRVNSWLLDIETESRKLRCGSRTAIYNHLASFLPCGKETLIKRAKKLRLAQTDDKLREPIGKIKEAINGLMPSLVEKHQLEVEAVQKQKIGRLQERQEQGSTESDDDGEKQDGDKQKRIMAPRKKFEWNNQTRSLLNNIVRVKMDHYEQSKVRSQTPEEYLKTFLEQEMKPLWPQGWIQTRMLFKESRAIHSRWTAAGTGPRPRKPLMLTGSGSSRSGTPAGTPTSKPSTPVTNMSTVSLLTTNTLTTPSSSMAAGTVLTPSVMLSRTLSSESSSQSSGITSPTRRTILDYAHDSHNTPATNSKPQIPIMQPQVDLSAVRVNSEKTGRPAEVKASSSFGFVPSGSLKNPTVSKAVSTVVASASSSATKPVAPPMIHVPKPASNSVEDSTMTFLEQFYQFATGIPQAMDVAKNTGVEVPVSAAEAKPKPAAVPQTLDKRREAIISTGSSDAVSRVYTVRPVVARGLDTMNTSKPHLAAALQGVYIPASGSTTKSQAVHTTQAKLVTSQTSQVRKTSSDLPSQVSKTVSVALKDLKDIKSQQYSHVNQSSTAGNAVPANQVSTQLQKNIKDKQADQFSPYVKPQVDDRNRKTQSVNPHTHLKQHASGSHSTSQVRVSSQPAKSLGPAVVTTASRMTVHPAVTVTPTSSNVHSGQPKPSPQQHRTPTQQTQRTSPVSQSERRVQAPTQKSSVVHSTKDPAFAIPRPKLPAPSPKIIDQDRVSSTSGSVQPRSHTPTHQPPSPSSSRPAHSSAFSPHSDRKHSASPSHSTLGRSPTTLPQTMQGKKLFPIKSPVGSSTGAVQSPGVVSSTTSSEPKFGGLTLSKLQEQTLKASQRAHVQAQYPGGAQSSPSALPYGGLYGSNSASSTLPSYQGATGQGTGPAASPTLRQSPDQGYGMQRIPQTVSPRTSHHNAYSPVPASPNSASPPFGHVFSESSHSQHRY